MENGLEIISMFSQDIITSIRLSRVSSHLNTILHQVFQLNNTCLNSLILLRIHFKKLKKYKRVYRKKVNSWRRTLKNMDDPIILTL